MLLVAEEFTDVTEPVQIPLHSVAGQVVSSKAWVQMRKTKNAITRIVVSLLPLFSKQKQTFICVLGFLRMLNSWSPTIKAHCSG